MSALTAGNMAGTRHLVYCGESSMRHLHCVHISAVGRGHLAEAESLVAKAVVRDRRHPVADVLLLQDHPGQK